MSVCYFLESEETHQCVHIATMSHGKPTGGMANSFVIQLFSVAHCHSGYSVKVTNDTETTDVIEWDEGCCIELFERMTQQKVEGRTKDVIAKAIESSSSDFSEYQNPNWLDNYTFDKNLSFYKLGERPS